MASSATITNPAGVWGATSQSDGQGPLVEHVAATTITAKSVVALSTTSGQVVVAATNQNVASLVGVNLSAGVGGNPVMCQVLGPCYGVRKDTGSEIAQFDRLVISATNTGTVTALSSATAITQLKDTGLVIGVAMAAAVTLATTVDVFLIRF